MDLNLVATALNDESSTSLLNRIAEDPVAEAKNDADGCSNSAVKHELFDEKDCTDFIGVAGRIDDHDTSCEVVYEELQMVAGLDVVNNLIVTEKLMAPFDAVSVPGNGDCEFVTVSEVIDEEPEYFSLSTNSEESGVTSPAFRYEEELDSLSLCSSTSVVDDREEDTTIIPLESSTSAKIPQHNLNQIPPESQTAFPVILDRRSSEETLGITRPNLKKSITGHSEKFQRQNLRSSILKRLTITWKREYDFQLETDKSFAEEENQTNDDCQLTGYIAPPPRLPSPRTDLSRDEIIRRHVLCSIIDSENSYVDSLFRLVKEFQEPLRDAVPPIISSNKIALIFSKIPQILKIHLMLRTALTQLMNDWKSEKLSDLGDIFVGLFSKQYVAESYANYVCNFATAIETVKRLSKERPAFAEFLRVRQESSKDRLPLFGLLVKPVQRFPQFILLLQDLLKNTPADSLDRISLQLALTHLETLADGLNERKRENEQEKAARDVQKWAKIPSNNRNSTVGIPDDNTRRVIAEDDFKELELASNGRVIKTKSRRLLLLNDLLICTIPRSDPNDKLVPQWIVNIADVEVVDEKPVKFLGYQISASASSAPKQDVPKEEISDDNMTKLYQEMGSLRQDYESVKRIHDIIGALKYEYMDLRASKMRQILNDIQSTIQVKMEQAARADDCTFQISIPTGKAKNQKTNIILQAAKRKDKLLWITLLHLTRLAYDKRKNPSWDDPDMKGIASPLFFLSRMLHLQSGTRKFSYKCGCYCFASPKEQLNDKLTLKSSSSKSDGLVFLCSSDGLNSKVSILSIDSLRNSTLHNHQQSTSIELLSFNLSHIDISCCEWIPGVYEVDLTSSAKGSLAHDSIWLGSESGSVMVFLASSKVFSLGSYACDAPVRSIRFNFDKVYVALANCYIKVFKRNEAGFWDLRPSSTIQCATSGVLSCVTDLPNKLLCAVDNYIAVINCTTDSVINKHQPKKSAECFIERMVRCGIGLWISYKNSSVISLFHIETFKFVQDLNVAPNINRILAERDSERSAREISVTSLLAIRGSLWIGTNVGLIVHITLPKLDGVPINLSRPAVSLHSHVGPAPLLLALQPRSITRKPPPSINPDSDFYDFPQKSFRLSMGNQLVLRNWSDDSPDINSLYDALMRGSSSSSEEEISSISEQLRVTAHRRNSLPILPVDAEFHPPRPVSFLRKPEQSNSLILRQGSARNARPMSFSPTSDAQIPTFPLGNLRQGSRDDYVGSRQSSRDFDHFDSSSKSPLVNGDRTETNKPKFVKLERNKSKGSFGTQWHSTLIVISAGSGYRMWRGSVEHDKDDSSLCVIGWEMKV